MCRGDSVPGCFGYVFIKRCDDRSLGTAGIDVWNRPFRLFAGPLALKFLGSGPRIAQGMGTVCNLAGHDLGGGSCFAGERNEREGSASNEDQSDGGEADDVGADGGEQRAHQLAEQLSDGATGGHGAEGEG